MSRRYQIWMSFASLRIEKERRQNKFWSKSQTSSCGLGLRFRQQTFHFKKTFTSSVFKKWSYFEVRSILLLSIFYSGNSSIMSKSRQGRSMLQTLFFYCLAVASEVEAASKKKKMKREDVHPLNGIYSLITVMGLVIIIPIALCIYNAAMDPITPTLLRNAVNAVKDRTLGNISSRKNQKGYNGEPSNHES